MEWGSQDQALGRSRGGLSARSPVTYGYIRVSKSDRDKKSLDTQVRILEEHGLRRKDIFRDVQSATAFLRDGWDELVAHLRPKDTALVCCLDRFSRHLEEGAHPAQTHQAGYKHHRLRGKHQLGRWQRRSEAVPEDDAGPGCIPVGFHPRADPRRHRPGPSGRETAQPALTFEDAEDYRRFYAGGTGYSLRQIARLKRVSKATVRKAVEAGVSAIPS